MRPVRRPRPSLELAHPVPQHQQPHQRLAPAPRPPAGTPAQRATRASSSGGAGAAGRRAALPQRGRGGAVPRRGGLRAPEQRGGERRAPDRAARRRPGTSSSQTIEYQTAPASARRAGQSSSGASGAAPRSPSATARSSSARRAAVRVAARRAAGVLAPAPPQLAPGGRLDLVDGPVDDVRDRPGQLAAGPPRPRDQADGHADQRARDHVLHPHQRQGPVRGRQQAEQHDHQHGERRLARQHPAGPGRVDRRADHEAEEDHVEVAVGLRSQDHHDRRGRSRPRSRAPRAGP